MADNTQVVNQAYEAFGRGDIEAVLALLSEDVDWSVPEVLPQGGSFHGRDEVGQFFAGLGREWPEFNVEVDDQIADGDNVAVVGEAKGKIASGGDAAYGFTHVFTLADGAITRFREYADPDATLREG